MPDRPNIFKGEPYAEVKKVGRFRYKVSVYHGATRWGPNGLFWLVLGHERAKRVAGRKLKAYRRYRKIDDTPVERVT